jgi:hypothetical protein
MTVPEDVTMPELYRRIRDHETRTETRFRETDGRWDRQVGELAQRIDKRVSIDTYQVDRTALDRRLMGVEQGQAALQAEVDRRFDQLDGKITEAQAAQTAALTSRFDALEQRAVQNRNLAVGGLLLPLLVTIIGAVIVATILSNGGSTP